MNFPLPPGCRWLPDFRLPEFFHSFGQGEGEKESFTAGEEWGIIFFTHMKRPSFTTAEKPQAWFIRLISANRTSFALLAALVALVLAYRVRLTYSLFTHPIRPFEFSPTSNPIHFTLGYGYSDLALITTCFLFVFLLSQIRFFLKGRSFLLYFRVAGLAFLHLLLGAVVFLHLGHFRFLFDAQTGFDFGVILESIYSVSTIDTLKLMEVRDCVFALFPWECFGSSS